MNNNILRQLDERMKTRGWELDAIEGMQPCHALDQIVTPYVCFFSALRRPFGVFIVEGAVGVIHRKFESAWHQQHGGIVNRFCVGLLTANFPELSRVSYVSSRGDLNASLDVLCDRVVGVLETLPHDEQRLREALKVGMGGHAFRKYAVVNNDEKFAEFCEFLQLQPD